MLSAGDALPPPQWPTVSPQEETVIQENTMSPAYKVNTQALIQFYILKNEQPSKHLGHLASLGLEYINDPDFQRLCVHSPGTDAAESQERQLIPANLPASEQARWTNVIVGLQRIHMTLNGVVYVTKHSPELLRSMTTTAAGAAGVLTINPISFGVALCQLAAGLSGLHAFWNDWYGNKRPTDHFIENIRVGTDSLATFNQISREVIESLSKETEDLQQRSHHLEALRHSIEEGIEESAEEVRTVLQRTLNGIAETQGKLQEANRIVMEADAEERNFSSTIERMHGGLILIKTELEEGTEGPISSEKIKAFVQQISGYEQSIRTFLSQAAVREEKRAAIRTFLAQANQRQTEMTRTIVEGVREFGRLLGNVEGQLEAQGGEIEKLNDTILKLRVKQMELLFLNRCEKTILQLMKKEIEEQRGNELQELLKQYGIEIDAKLFIGTAAGTLIPGGFLIKALTAGVINHLLAPPQMAPPEKTTVREDASTPFGVRFEFISSQGLSRAVYFLSSVSIMLRNAVRSLDVNRYIPEQVASASATAAAYLPSLPDEASPVPLSRTQGNLILRLGDQQMSLPINFDIEKNLTLAAVQAIAMFAKECLNNQKCSALELLTFLQQVTYLKINRGDKGKIERLIPSDYVVLFAPLLLELRGALHQFDPSIASLPETQVSRLMLVDSPNSSPSGGVSSTSVTPTGRGGNSPF